MNKKRGVSLSSLGLILLFKLVSADIVVPNPIEVVQEDPLPWGIIFGIVGVIIFASIILLRKIKKSRQSIYHAC
jgi:amino acid transporter